MKSWTRAEIRNFKDFFYQIKQITQLDKWTLAEKVFQVAKIFRYYESQTEHKLLNVQIENWGYLEQLCQCVNV
jgi:hypothetical protein